MDDPLIPAAQELDSGAADTEAGGEPESPKIDNQTQALLRKLRKVEKDNEVLRNAESKAQEAKMSESERLKSSLAQAEADKAALSEKLRQTMLRHEFVAAATKAGVQDVKAAYKLADMSMVEIDDDGNVTGIDASIADLKKAHKILFGAPNGAIGSAGGNPPGGAPGQLTAAKLRSMDPTGPEFRQAMADIAAGRIK